MKYTFLILITVFSLTSTRLATAQENTSQKAVSEPLRIALIGLVHDHVHWMVLAPQRPLKI